MSSVEQQRTPSPASPPQGAAAVKADGTSKDELSSGTPSVLPHVPSDIKRPGFTAHNRKALENTEHRATVIPDPEFFERHVRLCPESIVAAVSKDELALELVESRINTVSTKEKSLYKPVADLLTLISRRVFEHLKFDNHKFPPCLGGKPLVFLDHHNHPLTHFPVGRVEDKPYIVGVIGRIDEYEVASGSGGSYKNIPYYCVETVVEAKAIYGDGQAQATRYAFTSQQARPDRPGFYCLSVRLQAFQVVYSSPLGVQSSECKPWDDWKALCAYMYSLYFPPDDHILYDRTLARETSKSITLGPASWVVQTVDGDYVGASIVFVGDVWGRRTTVFRVRRDGCPPIMIKDSYIDCGRRFQEPALISHIHARGFVQGVVRHISAQDVKNRGNPILFRSQDGSLTRKKSRIVLADVGYDLTYANPVNDLLMAIYDALEVHRTLACDRQVLHRDMSMFNILMYPAQGRYVEKRYAKDFPPPIDDLLAGELRSPEDRKARCLIIDFDNSALLLNAKAEVTQKELRCRTGTPAFMARAVARGAVWSGSESLYWDEKMPVLEGAAKDFYIDLHGEERYTRYNDSKGTVHGGVPPPATTERRPLVKLAQGITFYHRWEYDAESIFWTMYSALLRVLPAGTPEEITETKESKRNLRANWKRLYEHVILDGPEDEDSRALLLKHSERKFKQAFLPLMEDVAGLLHKIALHVEPLYALMSPLPPYEDHLHEAMQRLILQYLVDHREDPIPLVPGRLRPVGDSNEPGVISLDTYGENLVQVNGAHAEEKRPRDPDETDPRPLKRGMRCV
ncbi:hypothetical protein C8Q79DRAFT_357576 [Trametes meyenii]|nr:hypothetical protein C8Q79DRAFT_357576 [Trametes meyenii]